MQFSMVVRDPVKAKGNSRTQNGNAPLYVYTELPKLPTGGTNNIQCAR
jgi:hypothetical protein